MSDFEDEFMSDEEIEKVFAGITPEDFNRETSATDIMKLPKVQQGPAAFNRFVQAMLTGVRESFDAASDQEPWQSTAVLQNGDCRRIFLPEDDETNRMFLNRLRREAQEFGARWFFAAFRSQNNVWASFEDMDERPDQVVDSIAWYAEAKESDFEHIRQGAITIAQEKTSLNFEGDPSGAEPLFRGVMA